MMIKSTFSGLFVHSFHSFTTKPEKVFPTKTIKFFGLGALSSSSATHLNRNQLSVSMLGIHCLNTA